MMCIPFHQGVARRFLTLCGLFLTVLSVGAVPAAASLMPKVERPAPAARVAFWNIPDPVVLGIAAANRRGGIDGRFVSPDLSAYDAYVLFVEPGQSLGQLPYGDLLELDREQVARGVHRVTRSGLPPVLIFDRSLLENGYDAACVGRLIHRTVVRAVQAGRMAVPQLAGCDSAVLGSIQSVAGR